jgi:UDP-glucose 4-epimerase
MHFAALIEAGESMQVPERYFRNNSAATLSCWKRCCGPDVRKFVFSSTAALYGEPKQIPIQEDDPLEPTNAYGESKLLVEQMLAWLHRIHGFRYASLRYFNAAGAIGELGEAHDPESHLIPLVLQVALGRVKKSRSTGLITRLRTEPACATTSILLISQPHTCLRLPLWNKKKS